MYVCMCIYTYMHTTMPQFLGLRYMRSRGIVRIDSIHHTYTRNRYHQCRVSPCQCHRHISPYDMYRKLQPELFEARGANRNAATQTGQRGMVSSSACWRTGAWRASQSLSTATKPKLIPAASIDCGKTSRLKAEIALFCNLI